MHLFPKQSCRTNVNLGQNCLNMYGVIVSTSIRIKICFLYRYCSMNINGMQEKIYENINVISFTPLLRINFFTGNTDREAGKYFREFDLHNTELSR